MNMEKSRFFILFVLLSVILICSPVVSAVGHHAIPNSISKTQTTSISPSPQMAPVNPDFLKYQTSNSNNNQTGLYYSPLEVPTSSYYTTNNFGTTTSYDLRSTGKLTPVKNQLNAGTCWAHAAIGSLESNLLTGETWDFSENNMKNLLSPYYSDGFDYLDGGNAYMATAYFARWSGPVNESDDPYNPNTHDSPTNLATVKHVQEVVFIPERTGPLDNDNIKEAVMNYGALYTSMYMSNSAPYYNSSNFSYYYNENSSRNHAVCIVGWDDNYDLNNFINPAPGNGAFIVRNSWGTGWGDDGYFYVSYYDTMFGSETVVFNNAEPTINYNRIYQYDPLGWSTSLGYGSNTAWFSNIFTSQGNDNLLAASFYTPVPNVSYELYAYLNPNNWNPRSGQIIANKTGIITTQGYKTITFDSTVPLKLGDKFSIVIKFTTPEYNYPIPIEYPFDGYSSKATANLGESFISYDGISWSDLENTLFKDTNVCLKAFTIDNIKPTAYANPKGGLYNTNQQINLHMSESGSIYFTLDGSDPSVSSTKYSGPFMISSNTVLKFIAVDLTENLSDTYTENYIFDRTAPTAYSIPKEGYYNTDQLVTIHMSESGSIYFTLDEIDPSVSSTKYSSSFMISSDTLLKFIAMDQAGNLSEIYTQNYKIDKVKPQVEADPDGNHYKNTQTVTLKMNEAGTIYYTIDKTEPTIDSLIYTSGIEISSNTTLNFIGKDLAGNLSEVYTEKYVIDKIIPTAQANTLGGWYNTDKTVQLFMSEDGKIYYTLDGTTPTTSSTLYTTPIKISSTNTLKYIAQDLAGNLSIIGTETYHIDPIPPTAYANPMPGLFNKDLNVVLLMNEAGIIYYTINKQDPTISSARYVNPLHITSTMVLKFIAKDLAGNFSPLYTYYYNIDKTTPTVAADIKGGTYNSNKTVKLTINEPGFIYYTVDGTSPTIKSNLYTQPILISTTTTLRYIGVDMIRNQSSTYTQNYYIDKIRPIININFPGKIYNQNKMIYLFLNEPGTIYYTLDGQFPTLNSKKYVNPLVINSSCILRYFAMDKAGNKSDIYSQRYIIDPIPPKIQATTPINNTTRYSRTANILIKFTEKILPSISWAGIKVKNLSNNRYISISKFLSGNILTIKTSIRSLNTWYQLIIPSEAVKDLAGNKIVNSYILRFRT
jgi:C1A family cysteine protease